MKRSYFWQRVGGLIGLAVAAFALGYPAIFIASHGLQPLGWPNVPGQPTQWFSPSGSTLGDRALQFVIVATKTYGNMLIGQSAGFPEGGRWAFLAFLGVIVGAGTIIALGGRLQPIRHTAARFGNARFARRGDLAKMRRGVELGLAPDTGQTVRIQLEGNVVTIAPPRSGKTSGLILPNLVLPEEGAWAGPVVCIDPKGEVIRAVRQRRETLGRKIRILDPAGIVGATDRWNPLLKRDATDILSLQAAARGLLPDTGSASDTSDYFKDRAVSVLVAALAVTLADRHADVIAAANLVSDPDRLAAILRDRDDRFAKSALSVLDADDRTKGSVLSSAEQAFTWATDKRLQAIVSDHTFELSEIAAGDTDLFVVLPADDRKDILAPYVRWLLSDLFAAVRTHRVSERVIVMIDEAMVLGRFNPIVRGMAELPGYGVSLWTFWQNRAQIIEVYGPSGANSILGTAEATILFNLSRADGDEREHWSKALGDYTGVETRPGSTPGQVEQHPVPVRLAAPAELAKETQHHSLVFLNSRRYTTDPLRLRKTSHDDPRSRGLVDAQVPIGPTKA